MAANFNSRMCKEVYPENKTMVMARVESTDREGVSVALLEYDNRSGRILIENDADCVLRSKVGRIEPMKVMFVDSKDGYISLQRSGTTFDERMKCEQTYNKRKYVHSVLLSVAEEENFDLERLYRCTRWPTYEELPELHKEEWVERKLKDKKVRDALFARIKLMDYFSWRIEAPWILNLLYVFQKLAACWCFGLIKHLEAYLKRKNKLSNEDYLSFQDFINKVPEGLLSKDGDVQKIEHVVKVLVEKGVLSYERCPMTDYETLKTVPVEPVVGELHKPGSAEVEFRFKHPDYEKNMMKRLRKCPFAASILWWPSYQGPKVDVILTPTDAEKRSYRRNATGKIPSHVMLMTGKGVDRYGVSFLELQENGHDTDYDRGFVRIAREPNPVIEYVIFRD